MKKNILFGLKVLVTILLISVSQNSYAQIIVNHASNESNLYWGDGNDIFIGEYTLDFKGTRNEAKLTINIPDGFSCSNFVYYSIQPLLITSRQCLGRTIEFWVKPHMWDGEEKVQLIIDTNVENHFGIVPGYYFLVANIHIMNLKP